MDGSGRPLRGEGGGDTRSTGGGGPRAEEPGLDWERLRRRTTGDSVRGGKPADPRGENGESGPAADWERLRRPGFGDHGGTPPPGGPASLGSLLVLLEAVRGMVPAELERQFSTLLREVLLTIRALIDWYLERLDGGREERRVEDIPID